MPLSITLILGMPTRFNETHAIEPILTLSPPISHAEVSTRSVKCLSICYWGTRDRLVLPQISYPVILSRALNRARRQRGKRETSFVFLSESWWFRILMLVISHRNFQRLSKKKKLQN